jgi:hypothetical protein
MTEVITLAVVRRGNLRIWRWLKMIDGSRGIMGTREVG